MMELYSLKDKKREGELKNIRYRTPEEEKEFIEIRKRKFGGVEGKSNRFYEICKHHRKPKDTFNSNNQL